MSNKNNDVGNGNDDDDEYYNYDLGNYTCKVTTCNKEKSAQEWFDRGLIWTYAYNHEESIRCYKKCFNIDSKCIMSLWGIAYAIGPNYNKPWEAFDEPNDKIECLNLARSSIKNAMDLINEFPNRYTELEISLIKALQKRYPITNNTNNTGGETTIIPIPKDFTQYNDAYANAMREVYKVYPNDLDVCCLFAEAIMNRTPWSLWDLKTGKPAKGADTLEALAVLDRIFENESTSAAAWKHPGLLHMYIHLMEMSPHPERALRHGDALSTNNIAPDCGHLLHMATHIDVLCGDYHNVVVRNHNAILVDQKYVQISGSDNFYALYRAHNYHFKIYGSMFLGQYSIALQTSNELESAFTDNFLQFGNMADWFEGFIPMKQHVLIRFGKWDDILKQELPENQELYCVTTTMIHYARTIALANLKQIEEATQSKELFENALKKVPKSRMLFNNTCLDILDIAQQMMLGELEYHKGNFDQGFVHLRKAVELDDNLPYDEPWGWMQPTRHALGALLLDQSKYDEAEIVYRSDLGLTSTLSRACQNPNNVWSLHGLYECLMQKKKKNETDDAITVVEAKHIKLQLDKAMARAEVPIKASCYCRHTTIQK